MFLINNKDNTNYTANTNTKILLMINNTRINSKLLFYFYLFDTNYKNLQIQK